MMYFLTSLAIARPSVGIALGKCWATATVGSIAR